MAGDLTANTIKKNFGLLSQRSCRALRIKLVIYQMVLERRDGSLSLSEVTLKAFEREPILFDVMLNSIARSDNPLVTVTLESEILQPKGGVYSFVGEDGENSATLDGIALSGSTLADGTKKYTATSGNVTGLDCQF